MAVSLKNRLSIPSSYGHSRFHKKRDPENTAIFNFTQNGTSQSNVSNSSNASHWKCKIMYRFKISAEAGIQVFSAGFGFPFSRE
jgi:hypothetical protein